jgi:hypothetical protein
MDEAILIPQNRNKTAVVTSLFFLGTVAFAYWLWGPHAPEHLRAKGLVAKYLVPPAGLFVSAVGASRFWFHVPNFAADEQGVYVWDLLGRMTVKPWSDFKSVEIKDMGQAGQSLVLNYKVDSRPDYNIDKMFGFPPTVQVNHRLVPYPLKELREQILKYPQAVHLGSPAPLNQARIS